MGLRWTDTIDIAIELSDAHPDVDPQWVRFMIYTHGFVLCQISQMILQNRLKGC